MPNETAALDHIRSAMRELKTARDEISTALLKAKEGESEFRRLSDLHTRITKAMTVLPHGGER
ncbi:MAG: hypothetical protein P8L68_08910 [Paracoccaceae bacterium]|nr:hypothetical protein [Paracoccaceae bacterium]MDG2258599.1 hypothetical protein [Paracoccaceae bacterium]